MMAATAVPITTQPKTGSTPANANAAPSSAGAARINSVLAQKNP